MSYILPSPAEVKRIIEAVNLNTHDVDLYEMGDRGISEKPFKQVFGGFKAILDEPDDRVFVGYGPDLATILSGPPDLQPPYPPYEGDPFMYFERPERFFHGGAEVLAPLGVFATPVGSPKENLREISLKSQPGYKYNPPAQAPRKDNVVHLPAVEKRPVRHDRPPRDVLKYCRHIEIGDEWKRLYFFMFYKSWYGPINQAGGYAGKSKKKMRVYTLGNKELARLTGLCEWTVSKYLMKLKKYKLILQHKRGYKGQLCSIWELPFSLDHVFAWRRQPTDRRHRAF